MPKCDLKEGEFKYSQLVISIVIFLGAFLLFQVQPIIAKCILPWFGGTPEVWTVCMLFFQVFLLIGYAYAHFLTTRTPLQQSIIHLCLIIASLLTLPILPGLGWKPQPEDVPAIHILLLLMINVGCPYFILSSTAPLLQSWYVLITGGKSPYRLYALSNAASLLALLSYPFLVEPSLTLEVQGRIWMYLYIVFAVFCGLSACLIVKKKRGQVAVVATTVETCPVLGKKPASRDLFFWFTLPFCGSVLLLGITKFVCQDIVVVPFLWVVPLALYLCSFILCFESSRWYRPAGFVLMYFLLMILFGERSLTGLSARIEVALTVSFALLFFGCMVCHGEVARLKPKPSYLTRFYLMISAGGAAGGVFVGLIAPYLFDSFVELQISLILIGGLLIWLYFVEKKWPLEKLYGRKTPVIFLLLYLFSAGKIVVETTNVNSSVQKRNFFGVLRIPEVNKDKPLLYKRCLFHGRIKHGEQFIHPIRRLQPTTYFIPESGVGILLKGFHRKDGRKIGVLGLGVGTLAAYGRRDDYFRFYEINPEVIKQARERFYFLSDSKARIDVVSGDARLSLEKEETQKFDILILDVFSGDAIPVHLLTKEALEVYLRHLKPDGILATHISSRYVDLLPVMYGLSEIFNLHLVVVDNESLYNSRWVLLSTAPEFLNSDNIQKAKTAIDDRDLAPILWTDNFSNLFQLLD